MTLTELWVENHPLIVGGIVVAVTAYGRFNVPPTSRSSTTWARYHAVACLYTLTMLVTWLLMSNRDIVQALARYVGVQGLDGLDLPIYAAVLLTVVVQVPPLSAFDGTVRRLLQELARIPWEAKRLSAGLQARTWLPDGRFQREIRELLIQSGFDAADVSFGSDRTPQALWTRVTALQRYVEGWQTRRGKFAGFHFANLTTITELRAEYDGLAASAKRVLSALKTFHGGGESLGVIGERELAEGFVATAARLQKDLCDLVSRGVLMCGLTGRARRAELETIGFVVNVTPHHLFDNLLGLHLALSLLYLMVLELAGRPNPGPTAVSIATTYVVAVVIAILVRRTAWAPHYPVAAHVAAAATAFACASVSSFALGVLTTGGDAVVAWTTLSSRLWPWGLMSAGVAALMVWICEGDERPGLRQRETVVTAAVCTLLAVPVVFLLQHGACNGACDAPPYWRVMLVASVMGGLIGWFVPTWYRRPEVMRSEYRGWRLTVSVNRVGDHVVAVVDGLPPPSPETQKPAPLRLPDAVEEACTDDAIGEAIRRARAWVDTGTAVWDHAVAARRGSGTDPLAA